MDQFEETDAINTSGKVKIDSPSETQPNSKKTVKEKKSKNADKKKMGKLLEENGDEKSQIGDKIDQDQDIEREDNEDEDDDGGEIVVKMIKRNNFKNKKSNSIKKNVDKLKYDDKLEIDLENEQISDINQRPGNVSPTMTTYTNFTAADTEENYVNKVGNLFINMQFLF